MEIQIGLLKMCIEADYTGNINFFERVFPIFSRNAFFDVLKNPKTQKAKFRAGGAEIARRGP